MDSSRCDLTKLVACRQLIPSRAVHQDRDSTVKALEEELAAALEAQRVVEEQLANQRAREDQLAQAIQVIIP